MQKNIAMVAAVLLFFAVLIFLLYPNPQKNQDLPFSDEFSVAQKETDVPFEMDKDRITPEIEPTATADQFISPTLG